MAPLPPSRRGQRNVKPDLMIDLSRRVAENAYDKKANPGGIVDMGSAINELMIDDLLRWQRKHETAEDRRKYLTYNDTQCSPDLPSAAASFMNHFFHPQVPLRPGTNVLAANGLTALLDTLFFNLVDGDDDKNAVVLVPTPGYGMFFHDAEARNGIRLVPVPCDDITAARFRQHVRPGRRAPELLARLDDAAAATARAQGGGRVAAVLVANPENPLAFCYSREMLRWLVRWCEGRGAHLVVDEVYALGTGAEAGDGEDGSRFTSVLSLELGEMRENVHVLWGMSKDFGLGGCRVGFLATYNAQLYQAMRTCRQVFPRPACVGGSAPSSMFTWVSSFGGIVSAKLLSDIDYVSQTYLPEYRKRLSERRRRVSNVLATLRIPYTTPDAAFFVFVDLSRWLSHFEEEGGGSDRCEIALVEYLIAHGVFLEPGRAFMATLPGYFRLNYGHGQGTFNLGMRRLASALKELDGDKDASSVGPVDVRQGLWQRFWPRCGSGD